MKQRMKLRLIRNQEGTFLYCPDGSIMQATTETLWKLLTDFKNPASFHGEHGYWKFRIADMSEEIGETLAFVDQTKKLIILDGTIFYESCGPRCSVKYLSASEYADKHGKGKAIIKRLCSEGRIPGAYKNSSSWLIPENAPYPQRKSAN